MYLFLITREDLLHFLPKNGVVAEIGVAEGGFSKQILSTAAPRKLHLIDPWQEFADGYAKDANNRPQIEMDTRANAVRGMFEAEIAADRVEIHRATSTDALPAFADGSLDWVYVDGNHTYEAVAQDLSGYWPKVRDDGFLLGHDYTNHAGYRAMGFGVVEAVNEFSGQTQTPILLLTFDAEPTYLLAKSPNGENAHRLLGQLMQNAHFVEIRDFPARGMQHKQVQFPDGGTKNFFSF